MGSAVYKTVLFLVVGIADGTDLFFDLLLADAVGGSQVGQGTVIITELRVYKTKQHYWIFRDHSILLTEGGSPLHLSRMPLPAYPGCAGSERAVRIHG